jgi:transcriptional regulator with XRE-family HTH domain
MSAKNPLSAAPPYAVEASLKRLGADLKLARLRRNLTIESVAAKIGTGPRAVRDAETGKATTSMVVYAALLWAYGLLKQLDDVARPEHDREGLTLSRLGERLRARSGSGLDNDF